MIEFERKVFIERSPQDVFDVLSDPAKTDLWQASAEAGVWTSEAPYGVGSTWKTSTKFLGRVIEADLEITGWDPPNRVSFKTTSGPIPFSATNKLEAQDGGTNLIVTGQVEFGGFFKLAEGLIGKQLEKQMDSDNNTLKLLMESNQL